MSRNTVIKKVFHNWGSSSGWGTVPGLPEDQCSVLVPTMSGLQNHLQLQLQGMGHPLLCSVDTCTHQSQGQGSSQKLQFSSFAPRLQSWDPNPAPPSDFPLIFTHKKTAGTLSLSHEIWADPWPWPLLHSNYGENARRYLCTHSNRNGKDSTTKESGGSGLHSRVCARMTMPSYNSARDRSMAKLRTKFLNSSSTFWPVLVWSTAGKGQATRPRR